MQEFRKFLLKQPKDRVQCKKLSLGYFHFLAFKKMPTQQDYKYHRNQSSL